MVYPQKLEFNNPEHLSIHFKDVKFVCSGDEYARRVAAQKDNLPAQTANLPTAVRVDRATQVGMSFETQAIYQSNNFNQISALQKQYQSDIEPLYKYIEENGYSAWTYVAYLNDSGYFAVWNQNACVYVEQFMFGNINNATIYQVGVSFGIRSINTGTISVQNFTIDTPYQFKNFIDGGYILARGLTPFFNRGLSFDYRKFAISLTNGANSLLGNRFDFYTPEDNIGLTVEALVFAVIYLGLSDMYNKQAHRTRINYWNWDTNNQYNILTESTENLLSVGTDNIPTLAIPMVKLNYLYVFPRFVNYKPDVVVSYSVHVYHNHVNTNIEQSQIAVAINQIQTNKGPNPYGVTFAANLPQLGNHGQYCVGQLVDPKLFLLQAQGKFVSQPLTLTTFTQSGTPITTSMVSTSQGVFNQLFDFRIHLGYNPTPSKL